MYEKINDWREALKLPIVDNWSLKGLEEVLQSAILRCAFKCANDNQGYVYTALSGGIDSSFCLTVIRRHLEQTVIRAFTIGTSLEHPDVQSASLMMAETKTNHYVLIPTADEIAEVEEKFIAFFPGSPKFPGDVGAFLLFDFIAKFGVKSILVHDGLDELLGGYWEHRASSDPKDMKYAFESFWSLLEAEHLEPLERIANHFGIKLLFPYLQKDAAEYISRIPLSERTSCEESKIPLRRIAAKYLPPEIISRPKLGFHDALKVFQKSP